MTAKPKRPVWAYIGLGLGGLVSITGNVLHSLLPPAGAAAGWKPEAPAVGVAAFWPLALWVSIEILARTDWRAGWTWVALRWGGLLPVAGVAAYVSWRHLSGLLQHWGEDPVTAGAGPAAVDGLIVMATAALIGASVRDARGHCADARTIAGQDGSFPTSGSFGEEYDPHEAAGRQAAGLLAEINEYLTAEAARIEGEHAEIQARADAEAARIVERVALTAERDAERAARRKDRAGWWPRLVALLGASGDRATDDEIRAWLADEAERTGAVPSRADIREFWGKAPANARLDDLRREVTQARSGEPAEAVPGTAGH